MPLGSTDKYRSQKGQDHAEQITYLAHDYNSGLPDYGGIARLLRSQSGTDTRPTHF